MKLYALSECCTPDARDAEGFVTDVFIYKSKDEAVSKMRELVDERTDNPDYFEDDIKISGENSLRPSGILVGSARAYDFERAILTWEIREYELY